MRPSTERLQELLLGLLQGRMLMQNAPPPVQFRHEEDIAILAELIVWRRATEKKKDEILG